MLSWFCCLPCSVYPNVIFLSQKKEWSDYASFAHDAVWTYAVALNQLLKNDSSALDKIDTNSTSA